VELKELKELRELKELKTSVLLLHDSFSEGKTRVKTIVFRSSLLASLAKNSFNSLNSFNSQQLSECET